ncbi:MAG TPA: hypothetical protein VIH59_31735 [Candidatus Tectomicrobia bacterium]
MTHNIFDQFNALVTRLAAADGTLAVERSDEILDTALAREVLAAIVAGMRSDYNPYVDCGPYAAECSDTAESYMRDYTRDWIDRKYK